MRILELHMYLDIIYYINNDSHMITSTINFNKLLNHFEIKYNVVERDILNEYIVNIVLNFLQYLMLNN